MGLGLGLVRVSKARISKQLCTHWEGVSKARTGWPARVGVRLVKRWEGGIWGQGAGGRGPKGCVEKVVRNSMGMGHRYPLMISIRLVSWGIPSRGWAGYDGVLDGTGARGGLWCRARNVAYYCMMLDMSLPG